MTLGFTSGKHYNRPGSGSDMLCLPADPQWDEIEEGFYESYRAYIYGSEIDLPTSDNFFPNNVYQQDMPCAVCRTPRSTAVMIPARTSCYGDWTLEYHGYLMAGKDNRSGSYNHICMDSSPEFLEGGDSSNNQNILYLVEAQCGSLKCPPYHEGRELACVVCSK